MPVTIVNNAILKHKLGALRQVDTQPDSFRRLINEISVHLFYEAAKNLSCKEIEIEAPFAQAKVEELEDKVTLLSVMRAGNGMLDSLLRTWPNSSVGHAGIYRDKFFNNTVEYYFKVPKDIKNSVVFILDPIIATGETALACLERLHEFGCKDVRFLSVLTSEQGLEKLMSRYPETHIYTLSSGDQLTDDGYLTPGIGDVGARYYNTL